MKAEGGKEGRIRAAAADDRPIYFWVAVARRPPPESHHLITSTSDAGDRKGAVLCRAMIGTGYVRGADVLAIAAGAGRNG